MDVKSFLNFLPSDFFTGVPDSLLTPFCDYLYENYSIGDNHIVAANEGNAVAIAAGYYMATKKIPVVYMQNSGQGNAVNPIASLLNEKVYSIPAIFVIGWRGEPGTKDEPQHVFQGEITCDLLDLLQIPYFVIGPDTSVSELAKTMERYQAYLNQRQSIALIIQKGALENDEPKPCYSNTNELVREHIIEHILANAEDDIVVSTTGKASREVFEIREKQGIGHQRDFLTVGSMGHSSSIAMAIAKQKPNHKVWCLDGDGAALMHLGAMPVIAAHQPDNMVHVLLNNSAHETVGGMPTVAGGVDWPGLAKCVGYGLTLSAYTKKELTSTIEKAKESECLTFVEICCNLDSRADLGRPTTTAKSNKEDFMDYLATL